jgi:hypothetical protein
VPRHGDSDHDGLAAVTVPPARPSGRLRPVAVTAHGHAARATGSLSASVSVRVCPILNARASLSLPRRVTVTEPEPVLSQSPGVTRSDPDRRPP